MHKTLNSLEVNSEESPLHELAEMLEGEGRTGLIVTLIRPTSCQPEVPVT